MSFQAYLRNTQDTLEKLVLHIGEEKIIQSIQSITDAFKKEKPLLVCGNGGSASDAMHIAGELVGRFFKERKGLNVICLSSNPAFLTAWSNDYNYTSVFQRQVEAYGQQGAVIIGLSTSGNSKNIIHAFEQAQSMNMTTIGLTGLGGGNMKPSTDILLDVPSTITPHIQEAHICLYHYICQEVEKIMHTH